MVMHLRQIRPSLEPMSSTSLAVLHALEPVVGRIIGVAVLKHACSQSQLDVALLQRAQVLSLLPHIGQSLVLYDRSTEVLDQLRALVLDASPPEGAP